MAVGDVARLALELAGQSLRTVVGTASSGRPSCITLDISDTQTVLNWTPKIDISAGLFSLLCINKNDQ